MSIHKPQTDTAFSCCSLCSFRHLDYSPPWSWAWVVFSHVLYIYLKKEKKKKGKKASGSQNIAFQVPQDILSNAKAWWYGPIINPLQQPLKKKKKKNHHACRDNKHFPTRCPKSFLQIFSATCAYLFPSFEPCVSTISLGALKATMAI